MPRTLCQDSQLADRPSLQEVMAEKAWSAMTDCRLIRNRHKREGSTMTIAIASAAREPSLKANTTLKGYRAHMAS